ncbi:cytochrome d ubiquinol oxidase subunit II [Ramlibacter sp.]|uniref:cytochrome d ubiquinol oxidase subunit II n=1 Tax=Ramlibacter sp. TaxID=1917967 RepID=UPI002624A889|nr:cytochrome d ubiquinol oxidase subunit II [Ramlibacter sp.]MDB5956392.1 cydB [Ramlibacter sp.]
MSEAAGALPVALFLILGFAVAMYVVLDGFDLGIGILFPLFRDEQQRDLVMNSVAPFWDGNETWLVLGGVTLWAAFPKAFAIILPALYLPVLVLLLALIFRGVAFEFRWVAKPRHRVWDASFAVGSALAAFAQGLVLGGILQEIPVQNQDFAGTPMWWLSPFAIVCGLGLVTGYALLGATWLMLRTTGPVEARARQLGPPLLVALLVFIAIVSVWTPLAFERVARRWFTLPNVLFLWLLPAASALCAWGCWRAMRRGQAVLPFACAVAIFLLAFAGLLVSNVPYLVPPAMTIWQAASAPATQRFYLVGAAILIPLILGYMGLVFWFFRGKLEPGQGYH